MSRIFDNIILFLNTYRIIYVKCARFQKIKKLLEKCDIKSLISFITKDKLNKAILCWKSNVISDSMIYLSWICQIHHDIDIIKMWFLFDGFNELIFVENILYIDIMHLFK